MRGVRINVVPLDCRMYSSTIEDVLVDVSRGLEFANPRFRILTPRDLFGKYGKCKIDGEEYYSFLQSRYSPQTLAVVSRKLKDEPELIGLAWMDGYAIARADSDYSGKIKSAMLARAIEHEILHWGGLDHHEDKQYWNGKVCLMKKYISPSDSMTPCAICQRKFSKYAKAA